MILLLLLERGGEKTEQRKVKEFMIEGATPCAKTQQNHATTNEYPVARKQPANGAA
jgi:hypothetical protein